MNHLLYRISYTFLMCEHRAEQRRSVAGDTDCIDRVAAHRQTYETRRAHTAHRGLSRHAAERSVLSHRRACLSQGTSASSSRRRGAPCSVSFVFLPAVSRNTTAQKIPRSAHAKHARPDPRKAWAPSARMASCWLPEQQRGAPFLRPPSASRTPARTFAATQTINSLSQRRRHDVSRQTLPACAAHPLRPACPAYCPKYLARAGSPGSSERTTAKKSDAPMTTDRSPRRRVFLRAPSPDAFFIMRMYSIFRCWRRHRHCTSRAQGTVGTRVGRRARACSVRGRTPASIARASMATACRECCMSASESAPPRGAYWEPERASAPWDRALASWAGVGRRCAARITRKKKSKRVP